MIKNIGVFMMVYLVSISLVVGQNKKHSIVVKKFTFSRPTKYAPTVTNKVILMMHGHQLFEVLDEKGIKKAEKEQYKQAGAFYKESESTYTQLKIAKSRYVLYGNLDGFNITRIRNDGMIEGYWAFISFTIKVVDIESGKTIAIEKFITKKRRGNSEDGAIDSALRSVDRKLYQYFKKEVLNYSK